jgi:NAD(P)-dependent dehydrogenase (short-subunit alcohol dehydrogenase family)
MAKKVVLVTGGGRGIGAAVSLQAAKAGYAVAVNYREKADRAEAIVAQIRRDGGQAIAVAGDVAVEADVLKMFATVDAELGTLTALVNSAGISAPHSRVDAISEAALTRIFAINVVGSFLCAREAIKRMSTAHGGKGGAIVNLSSVAARLGSPGTGVHYAATKGAIDSFTIGLAQEVASEGIRVNAVSPGVIDTEIQPAGRVEKISPLLPMKRAGQADEVAAAVMWLLADEASYVAGAVLGVSGAR